MKIVVMKFGGTSVADISKIKNVASIINKNYKKYKLVIVLSAMAGVTNDLQKLIDQIDYPSSKENDLVLTSGEQVTVGLLSMVLNKMKIKSIPLLGWQVPIITDSSYEKAKILNVNKDNILKYFDDERVHYNLFSVLLTYGTFYFVCIHNYVNALSIHNVSRVLIQFLST